MILRFDGPIFNGSMDELNKTGKARCGHGVSSRARSFGEIRLFETKHSRWVWVRYSVPIIIYMALPSRDLKQAD